MWNDLQTDKEERQKEETGHRSRVQQVRLSSFTPFLWVIFLILIVEVTPQLKVVRVDI